MRSDVQEDVVEILDEEVEEFGALFDAKEALTEVVLFTIVNCWSMRVMKRAVVARVPVAIWLS
jgi:hypothetical protein